MVLFVYDLFALDKSMIFLLYNVYVPFFINIPLFDTALTAPSVGHLFSYQGNASCITSLGIFLCV